MIAWADWIAGAVLIGSALVGGIFFAFSTFVMGALSQLKDEVAITTMQSINRVVINPWFLGVFMGTAALSLVLIMVTMLDSEGASVGLIASVLCYIVGTFMVTIFANVPLNNRLASLPADATSSHDYWHHYLKHWTRWNHIRTVAALLCATLILIDGGGHA
ncbi:DUF1772 domain-containing protein [Motiliproteus sediminis]|uniref:anthrone oxygenase family protein n=1 Tax=Motiliproteus sediminis TaxID=1468178 RepID=UPI001AEFA035|nr:anthrone oxygenase family protein [Motiliproteus sediminis]